MSDFTLPLWDPSMIRQDNPDFGLGNLRPIEIGGSGREIGGGGIGPGIPTEEVAAPNTGGVIGLPELGGLFGGSSTSDLGPLFNTLLGMSGGGQNTPFPLFSGIKL